MHHGHTPDVADGSKSRCLQSDMCRSLHVSMRTSGLEPHRDAKPKGIPWVPVLGVLCFRLVLVVHEIRVVFDSHIRKAGMAVTV